MMPECETFLSSTAVLHVLQQMPACKMPQQILPAVMKADDDMVNAFARLLQCRQRNIRYCTAREVHPKMQSAKAQTKCSGGYE